MRNEKCDAKLSNYFSFEAKKVFLLRSKNNWSWSKKENFYANFAKKLVYFFAWAFEKEAEQIPFASFRFKAIFFCKTGSPLSWVLALMKKVSEVDENSLCRLLIYVH